jgi:hypothetical protein
LTDGRPLGDAFNHPQLLLRRSPARRPDEWRPLSCSCCRFDCEPFSGSGTTILAAEMTGRCCHAIELDPAYVDVAVKRWQEFTGQAAMLEGDGRSFAELGAERQAEAA